MGQAVDFVVLRFGSPIIQQQDRALTARKILLERQDFMAVPQDSSGEELYLGERIQDHPGRAHGFDFFQQRLRRLGQLDLGGLEDGLLRCNFVDLLGSAEFENFDSLEGPAVGVRQSEEFVPRVGHTDKEDLFPPVFPLNEVLKPQRRLARAGIALDQMRSVARETPAQHIVQSRNAGGSSRRGCAGRMRS
jgi:hypothetical protein